MRTEAAQGDGVQRARMWPWLTGFLALVVLLAGAFLTSSRVSESMSDVQELLDVPDTPLTVVADPASPMQAPFTIATVVGPAASVALSLPGMLAGAKVLEAVEAAGVDPLSGQVVRSTLTSVTPEGALSPYITVGLVSESGYAEVVGVSPDGNALWYTPPLVQIPSDLAPGTTWTSDGLTLDFAPFRLSGTVLGPSSETGGVNESGGCVDLQTTVEQDIPEGEGFTTERRTTWCPGRGSVLSENLTQGVVTRIGRADEAAWPPLAALGVPDSRPAGTSLDASVPLTVISRPPLAIPTGMVMVNSASQDLSLITIGSAAEAGETSTLVWLQHPGGTILGTSTTADRIVVTTSRRLLQSFDFAGRLRWSAPLPDIATGAAVSLGDLIVVALVDGSVRAFMADTGEPQWTFRLSDVIIAPPVRVGAVVVAADAAGSVAAIGEDGAEAWALSVDPVDSVSPLEDGSIVLGQTSGVIALVDPEGQETWAASPPDSGVTSPPVRWGDVIAIPTDGGLRGLSLADGSVLWTLPDSAGARVAPSGLVALPDRILQVSPDGSPTVMVDLPEIEGAAPSPVFLARLGEEWVAVSQQGRITFLGVRDE